jgi:dTDP-4-dehydrorhamnose reductase
MERLKVLVLGDRGMLGHMVKKYFEKNNVEVCTVESKWPSQEFKDSLLNFDGDFIINCIGAIPQKTKFFDINYDLPVWMSNVLHKKIVHPGTDCEMDLDDYGISKNKASSYIKENSKNTKIIKTSIIGPELESKCSLMEWLLNSKGTVKGYMNAFWSGVTTLEWSKQCLNLINNWDSYEVETVVEGDCLSKYDLLNKIKVVFNKDIEIEPFNNTHLNKCITGKIKTSNIDSQLLELKEFYYNENS